MGEALRAQTDGDSKAGLGHGSYSLKAGAGLAAAAAGDGQDLDRDSEKLLQVRLYTYSGHESITAVPTVIGASIHLWR